MALPVNRLSEAFVGVDGQLDSQYSDYSATAVAVFQLADKNGNYFQMINNISGSTINPNGDTTYDAAPIGSFFVDGPGGKFYVKSSSTAWTEIT